MAETEPQPLLRVEGITKAFGGIVAIDDFSLTVEPGQIVALMGPNGPARRPPST